MGQRIVAIDSGKDNHHVLQRAHTNHPDALLAGNVSELVTKIFQRVGNTKISQLDIIGHGCPGMLVIGGGCRLSQAQWFHIIGLDTSYRLLNYQTLSLLKNLFDTDAVVRLHACRVAEGSRGELFLWQLADLWNVRVQGAITRQQPDSADRFEGRLYVEATGGGNLGNVLEDHRIQ